MSEAPQRIEVVPDLMTYLSVGATVLAAVLAVISIVYAAVVTNRTRRDAKKAAAQGLLDAAHDRRLQWELSVLGEMSRQHGITGVSHVHGYVRSLIREDADEDDLPLLRKVTQIYPTQRGQDKLDELTALAHSRNANPTAAGYARADLIRDWTGTEIEEAIRRRLP